MSGRTRVVVVTGLSGAGKSTALHALEDLGYFCVDNLPTALAPQAVEVLEKGGIDRIALGIDVRVRSFLDDAAPALVKIRGGEPPRRASVRPSPAQGSGPSAGPHTPGASLPDRDLVVLFLDAADATLLRRFSETRRPHPMTAPARGDAEEGPPPSVQLRRGTSLGVLDGIHLERERLAPLRAQASIDLDTSRLSVHDLRRAIVAHLGPGAADQPRMATRVMSFGYKYGVPVDAELLFDVRFLDNPYFVPELKELPGTDASVKAFVLGLPETGELLQRVEELLAYCLPRYEREGKAHLTVGIGCTGGRHRSVTLSTILAERLEARLGLPITVVHRDVSRKDNLGAGTGGRPEQGPGAGQGGAS